MRDLVATCRGDLPKTSMCPLVGCSKPSSILTVVDLPEPFGPSSPNTSPRRTSKSTLSTARALGRPQKSLNTFVSPRTATTTSLEEVVVRSGSVAIMRSAVAVLAPVRVPVWLYQTKFSPWQAGKVRVLHPDAQAAHC